MATKKRQSFWARAWNPGTAVNVLLIPAITVVIIAVGFYFSSKEKFIIYDQVAVDVGTIKMHNAAQDEQVKQIQAMLNKISNQVFDLQRVAPMSGPGSGAGSAVGGSTRQEQ